MKIAFTKRQKMTFIRNNRALLSDKTAIINADVSATQIDLWFAQVRQALAAQKATV